MPSVQSSPDGSLPHDAVEKVRAVAHERRDRHALAVVRLAFRARIVRGGVGLVEQSAQAGEVGGSGERCCWTWNAP